MARFDNFDYIRYTLKRQAKIGIKKDRHASRRAAHPFFITYIILQIYENHS